MPKQLSAKDGKKSSTRRVDTTIIVALIALIGTVATALFNSPVILEWLRNKPTPSSSSIQAPAPANTSNPMPVAAVTSRSGSGADCLTQHFAAIEPARQIQIEVGTTNQNYYVSSQDLANKDFHGPIGIRLTQNGNMIAALSFLFFSDSRLFKIASLVDSNCQAVTEYSNWDRGGDRNVLQDSETLKIDLTEGTFLLRFIFYGPGNLRFNLQQVQ